MDVVPARRSADFHDLTLLLLPGLRQHRGVGHLHTPSQPRETARERSLPVSSCTFGFLVQSLILIMVKKRKN